MSLRLISIAAIAVGLTTGFATGWLTHTTAAPKPLPTADEPKTARPEKVADPVFNDKIQPFLKVYCISCHNDEKSSGGIDLSVYQSEAHARKDRKGWEAIQHVILAGEMPPKKAKAIPKPEEKQFFVDWIDRTLTKVDCTAPKDPGRVTMRRLNRAEYNNTIRDLTGVAFKPADDFPTDDVGYGFDNIGDVLSMQPLMIEKYLAAADKVLDAALKMPEPVASSVQTFRPQNLPVEPRSAKVRSKSDKGRDVDRIIMKESAKAYIDKFNFPAEGEYIVRFRGWGTKLGGESPSVTIRVNLMLEIGNYSTKGNKYGIPINYLDHAMDIVQKSPYLDFYGFHFHGGYVHNPRVYTAAARAMVKLVKKCYNRGLKPRFVSLGGGFPAAIGDENAFEVERMKNFPTYFKRLLQSYELPPIELAFEPGKSIVLNAGIGLMRVISKKKLGRKRFVIADGSTYNFIPDALVQPDLKYDILPADKLKSPRIHRVIIAGNTCDCWDLITKDITMPKLRAGDLLTVMDVGAYASVMASNFNTIRRASMIMIYQDGSIKLIRRRDRFSEMFAPELDVLKVAGPNELEDYNNLYRVNVDKIWKGSGNGKKKNGNGHKKPAK